MKFTDIYKSHHQSRFEKTLTFIKKNVGQGISVLDLGVKNPFSEIMIKEGFKVENTKGEDLDLEPEKISAYKVELVTALEIFEHLLNPFTVLQNIQTDKLIATIPLRLWFSSAHKSPVDPWDRHFHEFEDWQFDWLLEKTGWNIKDREKWTSPTNEIGFRPILRRFTPRYYAVYAERN